MADPLSDESRLRPDNPDHLRKLAKHGVVFLDRIERFSEGELSRLAGVLEWTQVVATGEVRPGAGA